MLEQQKRRSVRLVLRIFKRLNVRALANVQPSVDAEQVKLLVLLKPTNVNVKRKVSEMNNVVAKLPLVQKRGQSVEVPLTTTTLKLMLMAKVRLSGMIRSHDVVLHLHQKTILWPN